MFVNAPDLPVDDVQRIVDEIVRLLENKNFSKLFGKNSKAEVPIMGQADGKIISGQIDRLVVDDDEVLIVDFKTNRPAAKSLKDVPSLYLKQLKAYKLLLEQIYVNKTVHTFILWTDTAFLMQIE